MNIITINNKHYIPARVVMLPISSTQLGEKLESDLYLNKDGKLCLLPSCIGEEFNFQHLYLVCDLPIEELPR